MEEAARMKSFPTLSSVNSEAVFNAILNVCNSRLGKVYSFNEKLKRMQ